MNTETTTSNKPKLIISIVVLAALVLLLVVAYFSGRYYYSGKFLPGTSVNGIACSGKNTEETQQLLRDNAADYSLTLKERDDAEESISGSSIDLQMEFDDTLDRTLAAQSSALWFTGFFVQNDIDLDTSVVYDTDKLETQISALNALQSENITKPADATVSEYVSGQDYQVVPEVQGNQLKVKKTTRLIEEDISSMTPELDLEQESCYAAPTVLSDNADLAAVVDEMNKYISTKVKIKFGKKSEVVDGDLISGWLKVNHKKLTVKLSKSKVSDYISELSAEHDTIYTTHSFTTTYGDTIDIENGDYGWWMNQNGTRDELIEALNSFESQTIKPVYLQEAASHGKHDYGKTYAEVDLGNQCMYYYQDGECVFSSYFVSGNPSTGHATPSGIYSITFKKLNQRMVGDGYDVLAYYWMPFNGDIGFHDATWRSSFGGSLYLSDGSHGCVNMPYENAQTLYSLIEEGCPVICYY